MSTNRPHVDTRRDTAQNDNAEATRRLDLPGNPALRSLIVNGDDFGLCQGVNAGIIDAHVHGILTSTTLMANGEAFDEAVALAHQHPDLGVGCHLVLVGGRPTAPARSIRSLLTSGKDTFPRNFNDVGLFAKRRFAEIVTEFDAQLEKILAAGIQPTHVDSHKHTHSHPMVLDALLEVAARYRISAVRRPFERCWWTPPTWTLRSPTAALTLVQQQVESWASLRFFLAFDRRLKRSSMHHPDGFYGHVHTGQITSAWIVRLLQRLPTGTSELMCHPARLDSSLVNFPTRLKEARAAERDALMAPAVRAAVLAADVRLVTFHSLIKPVRGTENSFGATSLLCSWPWARTRQSRVGDNSGAQSRGA